MKIRTAVVFIPALLMAAGSLMAGPLNPPAGPIAASLKTLTEVEPRTAINSTNTPSAPGCQFRITQPGSYYLTGNVEVFNIQNGIQVDLATDGLVTIDLNGFSIIGHEGTLNGIDVDGPFTPRVVIRNGFITSFDGNGIDATGAESITIQNVECARNGGKGFVIDTGTLTGCKAQFNSGGGFRAQVNSSFNSCDALNTGPKGFETETGCRFVDCTAKGATGVGIDCDSNCILTGCTVTGTTGYGVVAYLNCTLSGCTASSNTEGGFSVNQGCTVIGCTALSNTKWGFSGGSSNSFQGCAARGNGFAGFASSFSNYTDCTSHANTLDGFALGGVSSVTRCVALSNSGNGISGGGACIVTDCIVDYNNAHGISLTLEGNIIRGNTCTGNGQGSSPGAGIHTAVYANRIEDNLCKDNDIGISVAGTRSVIVRNTCAGNTTVNWSIAAGNSYGPIIDRSAAATPAVNGNSAAAQLGTTDPNANFTN